MHGLAEKAALVGDLVFPAARLIFTSYGQETLIYLQPGGYVLSSWMCCARYQANVPAEAPRIPYFLSEIVAL